MNSIFMQKLLFGFLFITLISACKSNDSIRLKVNQSHVLLLEDFSTKGYQWISSCEPAGNMTVVITPLMSDDIKKGSTGKLKVECRANAQGKTKLLLSLKNPIDNKIEQSKEISFLID